MTKEKPAQLGIKETPPREKETLDELELGEAFITGTQKAIDLIINKKVEIDIKNNERGLRQMTLYDRESKETVFFTDIPGQVNSIMRAVGME